MVVDPLAPSLPQPWAPWAWRRWMRWWPAVFLALLGLAGANWMVERVRGGRVASVAVPAIVLLLWTRVWAHEVQRGDRRRRWSLPALALVAMAASIALTQQSLGFWIVGLGLVPMFFVMLPIGWAVVVAVLMAAHVGLVFRAGAGIEPLSPLELAAFLASRGLLLVLLGIFLRSVVRQSARVQVLSESLEAMRGDLAAAERHSGALEERHRVARELHDTVSQGLSATVMHIEAAEQQLSPGDVAVQEQLRRARSVARESLEDMRRVVGAMRPELLEHAELPEAIDRVVKRWSERTGIPVRYAVTGMAVPLHAEADITLLRAVQESLANVRKHARATQVTVTLSYMDESVALDVRDDGRGMTAPVPEATAPGTHFGLVAMRERVGALGGAVIIETEPGQGTTISVSLPMWRTAETRIHPLPR